MKSMKNIALMAIVAIFALGGIGFAAYVIVGRGRTITTGNARIRTDLHNITATTPGLLQRFNAYEGMRVEAGQIIGWVQYGETFRSPIDGVVVSTTAVPGQQILPMQTLATIADTANIHIHAALYESDVQHIKLGQPAAVTLDGIDGNFAGYVRNIGRITELELIGMPAIINTGTFRRVTQTVPVEIILTDDIDLSYFLGTNARVSLPVLNGYEPLREIANNNGISGKITATGRVESIVARNIYPSHALRIDEVLVRRGDIVEAGQVLATLDITDLETAIASHQVAIYQITAQSRIQRQETQRMLDTAQRNISNNTNMHLVEAQAQLTASRLQLENARRMYDQITLDYENRTNPHVVAAEGILRAATMELERLHTEYQNMSALYTAGILARHDFRQISDAFQFAQDQHSDAVINHQNAVEAERRSLEQLRAALDSAEVGYRVAAEMVHSVEIAVRQEIESLESILEMAQIDATEQLRHYLAQMERHLEEGVITAPIGGTVTAVHAEPGEFSMARLFTVESLDALRVLARIREYDLPRIYIGQPVKVTANATAKQVHTGIVTQISPRAVSTFPVVEFEIEVTITSDYSLLPGMSARVQIGGE